MTDKMSDAEQRSIARMIAETRHACGLPYSEDFIEYEFTRPDGSKRYAILYRMEQAKEVDQFMRMLGAIKAEPVK